MLMIVFDAPAVRVSCFKLLSTPVQSYGMINAPQ